jgi:inosine triphosphate pyrophosphatase
MAFFCQRCAALSIAVWFFSGAGAFWCPQSGRSRVYSSFSRSHPSQTDLALAPRDGDPNIGSVASSVEAEPVVITFVTGNTKKLVEAQMIIDSSCRIPFKLKAYGDLDLDELQSDIPEKIAAAKCRLAATAVGGPVMIDDTSLCFSALGGLPGPYIKWFMDRAGCDGLVKMLNGFDTRAAWAQCSIAFSPGPGAEPCVFSGRTDGTVVSSYNESLNDGLGGFGW